MGKGESRAMAITLIFQGARTHELHELKSVCLDNCDKREVNKVHMVGTCDCLMCGGRL